MEKEQVNAIKSEVDRTGYSINEYEASGYNCYSLVFEKTDNKYCVFNHLSTESGYEEDLDLYCESENFDDLIDYVEKEGYRL